MTATALPAGSGRRAVHRYVPPQHGAWAMLLVPLAIGVACGRVVWLHVPLLVAWLAGYLLSYYVLLAVKTRRPARVAGQIRLYGAICLPCAALVMIMVPAVLEFAPGYLALVAINIRYARIRRERALVNDLASVAASCLLVPVALVVAGDPAARGIAPATVVFLYFTGCVLFVKTMIRNRGEPTYRRVSVIYHLAATGAVALYCAPLGVFFAWLTVRACVLPSRRLTPMQVGLVEAAHCAVLLVAVPLLLR